MGLLDLFIAGSMPVLKLLLVTALGAYLALDRVNILGADARKHLNNVVFYVLNPALAATSLDSTITLENIVKLWFMPINILMTFLIGSILGWLVIHLTRAPKHLRGLILACSSAGNLGNLLLVLVPAACKEKGSPFGDPATCHTYGMAYASLSMALGNIYIWTYIYNIVRVSSTATVNDSVNESFRKSSESDLASCSEEDVHGDVDAHKYLLLPSTASHGQAQLTAGEKMKQSLQLFLEKTNLKKSFAPTTIGTIIGFLIGLVPQIQNLLVGQEAPLRVIQDSASFLGDASIPSLTLIVGGNLLKGLQQSGIRKSIIIGIVVSRYIILPLVGTLAVKGAIHLGLVQADPLYKFVLLLQYALPPALNIGTIAQLFGTGENECSVIMLWTYVLASLSLSLWSTYFMWLVS